MKTGLLAVPAMLALFCVAITATADPGAVDAPYQTLAGVSPQPLPPMGFHDPDAMKTFMRKLMQDQLATGHIAGAAVALVQNGRIIFSDGYGYADVEKRIAVDPARTLFRPGSVSKLFTWTAAMQLAESGRLDLDADINDYLDGLIPATFPGPITMRNLMTHTSGFESNNFGYMAAKSAADLIPLAEMVARHVPARVRPAASNFNQGELAAYNNWGAALAGRIVELRADPAQSFDDYTERYIFGPLQMTRSTFREPMPAALQADSPIGYTYEDGAFKPQGLEFYHGVAPAGGLTSTANDMANFMIAHLQQGRFLDTQILREPTARRMQSRLLSPSPYLNGSGYGFMETYINGRRTIGHTGKTAFFASELVLLPEENLGLFIAYNTMPPPGMPDAAVRSFFSHFFPAMLPLMKPPADFGPRAARYVGTYNITCRSYTRSEKLLGIFPYEVSATDRNTLLIAGLDPSGPTEWVEADAVHGLFRRVGGEDLIAFTPNAKGEISYILGPYAFAPAQRIGIVETPQFTAKAIQGFTAVFLLALVFALPNFGAGAYRGARWLAGAVGTVNLLILQGREQVFQYDVLSLLISLPPPFMAALWLAILTVPLTVALAVVAPRVWRHSRWPLLARIEYAVVAVVALVFLAWLNLWNLIGFNLS